MTHEMKPETDLSALESEFDSKCQGYENRCPNRATWTMWFTHSGNGCPAMFLMCDRCRLQAIGLVMTAAKKGMACATCHQVIAGDVDEHVRDVPL